MSILSLAGLPVVDRLHPVRMAVRASLPARPGLEPVAASASVLASRLLPLAEGGAVAVDLSIGSRMWRISMFRAGRAAVPLSRLACRLAGVPCLMPGSTPLAAIPEVDASPVDSQEEDPCDPVLWLDASVALVVSVEAVGCRSWSMALPDVSGLVILVRRLGPLAMGWERLAGGWGRLVMETARVDGVARAVVTRSSRSLFRLPLPTSPR